MAQMRVRYKGAADTRILSADDLKEHGVNVSKDLVFERKNLWSITMDVPEALENLFRIDGAFRLEAVTDEGSTETVHDGDKTDDTGTTVVDETTGQKSTKDPE